MRKILNLVVDFSQSLNCIIDVQEFYNTIAIRTAKILYQEQNSFRELPNMLDFSDVLVTPLYLGFRNNAELLVKS